MKSIFFIKNFWKSAVLCLFIMYLCFVPQSAFEGIPTFKMEDKFVHSLMFLVLSIVLRIDFEHFTLEKTVKRKYLTCVVFPVLFGLFIELVQGFFISSRTGDPIDWLFDILGVVIALFLTNYWFRQKNA